MKHLLRILGIAVVLFAAKPALAQDNGEPKKTKKQERAAASQPGGSTYNYTGENDPTKPDPYASNTGGGFTVTKYKEGKVTRKLRRGEAHSRLSVPNPKGK